MIKFFSVCIARSTTPVPVCSLRDIILSQIILFVQNSLYSLDMKALPLSDFFFSGPTKRLMKFSRTLITSLASVHLHIRTTGHLLYRSFPIKVLDSSVTCFLCNLPENSIFFSFPGSINTDKLSFLVIGKWYFKFLPELKQTVHALHFSSMSFHITDQQNLLLSASIFVEPGCPKYSAFTTCFLNTSGITNLPPAMSKTNLPVSLVKTGENSSGVHSF